MESFTIKDLENLSGIKAHTIRIWEQRYQFIKPCRTCTNIRTYSIDELKKILNIALLNKYGYKISHIDKMGEEAIKETILSLTQAEALHERIINELIENTVDLDLEVLETIITRCISKRGVEDAFIQIIFPFLERVAMLWRANNINPAQQQLVTNIIRRKLIVGIENVSSTKKVDKSVLLFLPENEHRELGLLFVNYLLKKHGITTIYLGANISFDDMEYVVNCKKPTYLYSHLTCFYTGFCFDKFIKNISQRFAGKSFIISGVITQSYKKKLPAHISLKKSFTEVAAFVAEL